MNRGTCCFCGKTTSSRWYANKEKYYKFEKFKPNNKTAHHKYCKHCYNQHQNQKEIKVKLIVSHPATV